MNLVETTAATRGSNPYSESGDCPTITVRQGTSLTPFTGIFALLNDDHGRVWLPLRKGPNLAHFTSKL